MYILPVNMIIITYSNIDVISKPNEIAAKMLYEPLFMPLLLVQCFFFFRHNQTVNATYNPLMITDIPTLVD